MLSPGFNITDFPKNLAAGIAPVFMWNGSLESVFMTPLISLPMLALALVGLFSTTKGFFASRNSIATLLFVFTLIITGFNPDAVVFFILPLAIIVAHGLKYLLEKWYGLFPENPYARIAAIFPLIILFAAMILPSLLQYVYGYRYNPNVVNQFSYELEIVRENLTNESLLVTEHEDFYRILDDTSDITLIKDLDFEKPEKFAKLGGAGDFKNYVLERIITSPMRENSDIMYLYTVKGE